MMITAQRPKLKTWWRSESWLTAMRVVPCYDSVLPDRSLYASWCWHGVNDKVSPWKRLSSVWVRWNCLPGIPWTSWLPQKRSWRSWQNPEPMQTVTWPLLVQRKFRRTKRVKRVEYRCGQHHVEESKMKLKSISGSPQKYFFKWFLLHRQNGKKNRSWPLKTGTLDAPCKVQIAAQGILTERVKQGPAGTRSLSFKTKLFAPLGKAGNGPELGECVEND